MSLVPHAFASSNALVEITDTSWDDILALDASEFEDGGKYLIVVNAAIGDDCSGDFTALTNFRVVRGSTELHGSFQRMRYGSTDSAKLLSYSFMTVLTQPGSAESIILQAQVELAGTKARAAEISIFAMQLDGFTEDEDYFFAENDEFASPDTTATSTGVGVSTTFGDGESEWLLLGCANVSPSDDSGIVGAVSTDIESSSQRLLVRTMAFDEQWVIFASTVQPLESDGAASMWLLNVSPPDTFTHYYSNLFGIRLSAFLSFAFVVVPTAGLITTTTKQLAGVLLEPPVPGDIWLLGEADPRLVAGHASKTWLLRDETVAPTAFDGYNGISVSVEAQQDARRQDCFTVADTDAVPYFYMGQGTHNGTIATGEYWFTATLVAILLRDTSPAGEGAVTIGSMTAAGIGTFSPKFSGVGDVVLGNMRAAGIGDFEPPVYTGAGAVTLGNVTAEAAGTVTVPHYDGTGAAILAGLTTTGSGTYEFPPCPDFEYDPHGREPIGIAQRLGLDYPLVDPSADIKYLLADFFLGYEDPADYDPDAVPYVRPFHIYWMFGFGCLASSTPDHTMPAHDADIIIKDANDITVFDSRSGEYATKVWSNRLTIHEWTTDTAVCRLVAHTKWRADTDRPAPQQYDVFLQPDNGILDEETLWRLPRRLKSLIVNDEQLTSEIVLAGGYNTTLAVIGTLQSPGGQLAVVDDLLTNRNDGGRAGYQVELAATPGSGDGRYPGCQDVSLVITTLNGTGPDAHGNLTLAAGLPGAHRQNGKCYTIVRPTTVVSTSPRVLAVTPHTLQLNNDCVPCCDCPDYVEVKLAIDVLYDRWKTLGQRAETIRDQYAENRLRWLEQKECRENQPQQLNLVTACDGFLAIGYSFCNLGEECLGPLDVTFEIETKHGEDTVDRDVRLQNQYTRKNETGNKRLRPYQLGGEYPSFTASWDTIDSFHAARLSFMLQVCDAEDGDSFVVTATPVLTGGADFDPIAKTTGVELSCPEERCSE